MADQDRKFERVLVVGQGAVTPHGLNRETTWQNTVDGVIAIKIIPDEFLPENHYNSAEMMPAGSRGSVVKHGGFLPDGFEPTLGLPPKIVKRRERCTQMLSLATREAMNQSKIKPLPALSQEEDRPDHPINRLAARRVVTIGSGLGEGVNVIGYDRRIRAQQRFDAVSAFKVQPEVPATTQNQIHNFQGPGKTEVIACASGGGAVIDVARKIRNGEADLGIAGAVDSFVRHPAVYGVYQSVGALATFKEGEDINPYFASMSYDHRRRGFVHSEAAAVVVLESETHFQQRLERGEVTKDDVLAELVGFAETNDASPLGTDSEPSVRGQSMAMMLACEMANIDPEEIDYINGHGTGTRLGDPVEAVSIAVSRKGNVRGLYLSGTKSMRGHGISSTGVIEAQESIDAIRYQIIPPTPNHDQMMRIPSELLERWNLPPNLADRLTIPQTALTTPVRYAMSNGFGFGGNNNALIFKEYDGLTN